MALKPVYYIFGTEDYLIEEACSSIKKEGLSGPFASMNYHIYEGKGIDAKEVISTALTMPAFSDMRVVVVKGAESIKAAEEKVFAEYVKNPSPSTCLVFLANVAKADKASALVKALDEKGFLKSCTRLSDRELLSWIKNEAKRQSKGITDAAAQKLLDIAGNKLRDIKGELDKIVLFIGEKAQVDDKDVEDACLDCREETIFGLSDAIGAKDLKKALKVYDKLSGEKPLNVLGAISRQIRVLLKLKSLINNKVPSSQYPSMVGVPPFAIENYVRRAKLFTEPELKKAVEKLYRADTDLKTGRAPEATVLPRLIMELCEKRQ